MDELSENLSAISFSFVISNVSSSSDDLVQASGRCSEAAALSEVQERRGGGGGRKLSPLASHFGYTKWQKNGVTAALFEVYNKRGGRKLNPSLWYHFLVTILHKVAEKWCLIYRQTK